VIKFISNRSLIQLIFIVLIITAIINISISFWDVGRASNIRSSEINLFFPPPVMIGTIWTLLMLGLCYCFISVKNYPNLTRGVFLLFWLCVLYPLYTKGFSSLSNIILANLITIFYSSFLVGVMWKKFKLQACILGLIPSWVVFVTYLMFMIFI
jgi:hypothetical protein